jgi:hypothetical protein
VPLKSSDFSWARGGAYAPKVIERDGRFFFYAPAAATAVRCASTICTTTLTAR